MRARAAPAQRRRANPAGSGAAPPFSPPPPRPTPWGSVAATAAPRTHPPERLGAHLARARKTALPDHSARRGVRRVVGPLAKREHPAASPASRTATRERRKPLIRKAEPPIARHAQSDTHGLACLHASSAQIQPKGQSPPWRYTRVHCH